LSFSKRNKSVMSARGSPQSIVDEFRSSALTVVEWSGEGDMKSGQLYYWASKFGGKDVLPPQYTQ
jgi:hypothetical protein